MKAFLCVICYCLLFINAAHADWIGEKYEEVDLLKPSKFTEVKKYVSEYLITYVHTTRLKTGEVSVLTFGVSKKTGIIESVEIKEPNIYEAVSFASFLCNGEVDLPTKTNAHGSFDLKNIPGGKNAGKLFNISVTPDPVANGTFALRVSCVDYQ